MRTKKLAKGQIRAESGKKSVIPKKDKTAVKERPETKKLRPFGLCAGEFAVPDDFDDLLPQNIVQDFECH